MKLNNYWQKFRPNDEKPTYTYTEAMELGQKVHIAKLIFQGHSEEAQATVKKDAARSAAAKMLEHFPTDLIAATMSKHSPDRASSLKISSSTSSSSPPTSTCSSPSNPKPPPPLSSALSKPKHSTSSSSSSSAPSTPEEDPPSLNELAIRDEDRAERKFRLEELLNELLPQRQRDYAEFVQKYLAERDPYYDNLHANLKLEKSPKSALIRRILDENIDVENIRNVVPTFERIMKQMRTPFYCKFVDTSTDTTYVCVIRVAHNTLTFMKAAETPKEAVEGACRDAIRSLVLFLRELN